MQTAPMTTRRWMIAVGVFQLGTTSTAAIEMGQFLPFVPPPTQASSRDNDIPRDFRLEAQYYPGGSMMSPSRKDPWKTTITSDGKVSQEIYSLGPVRKKLLTLSKRNLSELHSKIKESDFFKLKKQYLHGADNPHTGGLRLKVSLNGKTHEVDVIKGVFGIDPADEKEHPDIKIFMKIWDEVLKKVPPPERPQKPE